MRIERRLIFLISLLTLMLANACGGGGGSPGMGDAATAPATNGGATFALALTPVASQLASPVFLGAPPGDARLFIVERAGRVRIVQDGALLATPFLDISALTSTDGERGLLSLAFHPDYVHNGQFFVSYTDRAGSLTVARMTASAANPNLANAGSHLTILSVPHPGYSNHNGGMILFGPEGYLYVGTGDGGGEGDPNGNAHKLGTLLGKLLRIDVNGSTPAQPYVVPYSNPFVGRQGARGEIWAYGLRNPWRFAIDTTANLMYIADVGQDTREEVDIANTAVKGNNYGWNVMEGTACFNAASCNMGGLVAPAFEYTHGAANVNGCAIVGGYAYRGKALPQLQGQYFYSDYCAGTLKSFLYSGGTVSQQTTWPVPNAGAVLSFGVDAAGELYLLSDNGKVYRIERKP